MKTYKVQESVKKAAWVSVSVLVSDLKVLVWEGVVSVSNGQVSVSVSVSVLVLDDEAETPSLPVCNTHSPAHGSYWREIFYDRSNVKIYYNLRCFELSQRDVVHPWWNWVAVF